MGLTLDTHAARFPGSAGATGTSSSCSGSLRRRAAPARAPAQRPLPRSPSAYQARCAARALPWRSRPRTTSSSARSTACHRHLRQGRAWSSARRSTMRARPAPATRSTGSPPAWAPTSRMGWRRGLGNMLRVLVPNALRRVLVLTDGYPSRGESNVDALRPASPRRHLRIDGGHRRQHRRTSARPSRRPAGSLPPRCATTARSGDVVAAEVGGAKAVVARDVNVVFPLARVERAELLHRYLPPRERAMVVRVGRSRTRGAAGDPLLRRSRPGSPTRPRQHRRSTSGRARGGLLRAPRRSATPSAPAPGRSSERRSVVIPALGLRQTRRRWRWELLKPAYARRGAARPGTRWTRGDREAVAPPASTAHSMRLLVETNLVQRHAAVAADLDVVQEAIVPSAARSRRGPQALRLVGPGLPGELRRRLPRKGDGKPATASRRARARPSARPRSTFASPTVATHGLYHAYREHGYGPVRGARKNQPFTSSRNAFAASSSTVTTGILCACSRSGHLRAAPRLVIAFAARASRRRQPRHR